jgi:hypothetical protein
LAIASFHAPARQDGTMSAAIDTTTSNTPDVTHEVGLGRGRGEEGRREAPHQAGDLNRAATV